MDISEETKITVSNLAMESVKFNKSFLHADVLCIKHHFDYVLAGIGGNLFIYKNETLILCEPIFKDERIHSIYTRNKSILLKGGKRSCLLNLETSGEFNCEIISQIELPDWIQDIIIIENQIAALVTAHNALHFWSLPSEKCPNIAVCEETCILYSCKIIGHCLENLTVFAGTVFGDVLIWAPIAEGELVLQRIKAHNGAVFSVEVKTQEGLITTTSDDRSLKVWSIISSHPISDPKDWKDSNIQLTHTLFGHTARVWRSMILPNYYLTTGEDSQLIVWSRDGKMVKNLFLHQESGIRAVDYSEERDLITTGGEDGGINVFSLDDVLSETKAKKIFDVGHSTSTKVSFTKTGLVFILNGVCTMVSDAGEEVIYESKKFSSYCVLEVSPGGEHIALGSISGDVVVLDLNMKQVIAEREEFNGRVYSIHWLGDFLVSCGPNGRLSVWETSGGNFIKVNTMSLPNCRERWTTCGAIHNGKLVLGDRMGGVHLYELRGGENPLKSFRKIHSYLGVTDVKSIADVCLSVGRDGTVKEFTGDLIPSTTSKLPMDWPWKIINHENDILILGFHGASFIVWDVKTREKMASHDCGGGHRSCDYRIHKNKLSFLYVKEKKVFVAVVPLNVMTRLRNGFHGREINCLKMLNDPTVIVTGSEDTTLRVSVINGSDIQQKHVLKAHISSIRALCACYSEPKKITIVSVGGKGQIVIWDMDLNSLKCREMVNHRLRKGDQNWKNPSPSIDPETRIMCIDISKSENEYLIAAGCSDCHIRIFAYRRGELTLSCVIPYTHCILNVAILKVNSARLVVSMGTDGRVVFWDVTNCADVNRLESFALHQSGVNSFHLEDFGCGKFILATGGDDNLVAVSFVQIEGRKINLRQVWSNRTAHSCQVTGIKIMKNLLVTASIDQRITVWKWCWQEGEFTARFHYQCMTAVPDIQGMDAAWQGKSAILVTVHGKGVETLRIDTVEQYTF